MEHRPLLAALLITLMLLSAPAVSVTPEIKDPSNIGEMKVKITQYGKIIVSGSDLEWARINLTFPAENENQDLETYEEYTLDDTGNNILTIRTDNPSNTITYRAESIVTVRERTTVYIPETYTIPDYIEKYMQPTENIQSDDPRIKSLAEEITKDSKTDFERIGRLATWVHENIEYKLSLGTVAKDALWTYENRVGTCDEFSALFIALARASGYPARYISGYAYGKNGWEKHAFAEVYLGTWIPIDPTWNEVGNLDATHLQFTTKKDSVVKNEVQVLGRNIRDITWTEDETEIEILEVKEKQKEKDYELIKSSEKLEMGEDAVVVLSFTPKEYKVVKIDLESCISSSGIAYIENKEKSVILEPGIKKTVYWKIKISNNLRENMEYVCPLTLNSRLLSLRAINLTINTLANSKPDDLSLVSSLEKKDLILGEDQTIDIEIEKTRGNDPATIGIITESDHTEKTLSLTENDRVKISHTFRPSRSGTGEVVIYTSTGKVESLPYTVGKTGDIFIDKIDAPAYVKAGDESTVTTTIKNNRNAEETIRFRTSFDGSEEIQSMKILRQKDITTKISSQEIGNKKITFHLSGEGIDSKTERTIRIFGKPEPAIKTKYDHVKGIATLTIESATDVPKNITIEINGIRKTIQDPGAVSTLEFGLPVGTHQASVEYTDLGGTTYKEPATITIKEENMLMRIIHYISRLIENIR